MKLIVTRPEHDVTTKYLSAWAGEIIDFAKKKGCDVCDLIREKAEKTELEGRLKKIAPDIVFLNGHGDDDCVTGHDNKVLIHAGKNSDILAGKIIYALSCNSGKNLGPEAVRNGASAYIGYADKFIFVACADYSAHPLNDPMARPFMESSNQVMITLLKGGGAQKASERSKNKFKDNYLKLLSSASDPDSLQAAQCLWWNMRNQVCLV